MTKVAKLLSERRAGEDNLVALMVAALPHVEELSWSQIRAELLAELGEARLQQFLDEFEADPEARVEAASLWLATAGADPAGEKTIAAAVDEAGEQLAVIEMAMVSLIALYAIHVIAKPKTKEIRRMKRGADGSYEEVEEVHFQPFTEAVRGFLGALGRIPGLKRGGVG